LCLFLLGENGPILDLEALGLDMSPLCMRATPFSLGTVIAPGNLGLRWLANSTAAAILVVNLHHDVVVAHLANVPA
jgi:hypothetical protein